MERNIGSTDLRRRLTDILQAVGEEREAFFDWLESTAVRNAEHNTGLSDDEVLTIIERTREDAASATE